MSHVDCKIFMLLHTLGMRLKNDGGNQIYCDLSFGICNFFKLEQTGLFVSS